jgi:hypothetical protein
VNSRNRRFSSEIEKTQAATDGMNNSTNSPVDLCGENKSYKTIDYWKKSRMGVGKCGKPRTIVTAHAFFNMSIKTADAL